MHHHARTRRLVAVAGWIPLGALLGGVALGLLACVSPPLESPHTTGAVNQVVQVPQNLLDKVDILFMVDNSNSMAAMQMELQTRFGQFFQPFQDLAAKGIYADLNIGVVTSDYGAGATGALNCSASPGGQLGRLQAIGAKALASCQKPVGANFIHYAFHDPASPDTPQTSNLPLHQNLLDTFTCMASVGDQGCGFEHQLESVYAALRNNLPENIGFVRDDALLVVVFLTNEDDSSAPPETLMFDPHRTDMYGYESSFRSTRFGVMCGSPPMLVPYGDSGGPLSGCIPATNPPGEEYDVSRYITLFNAAPALGGVKVNPLDVVLVGIDAPETPFQVILSNPSAGATYPACGQIDERSNPPCVPVLQHSCSNPLQPGFFGDPAVRLNTVIRSAHSFAISSICDGDYTAALNEAAGKIVSHLDGGCIPGKFPSDPAHPGQILTDCSVEDNTANPDGSTQQVQIPECDAGSAGVFPCWRIEVKDSCKGRCEGDVGVVCMADTECSASGGACGKILSPDGVGLTIDRNGQAAPPHTTATVSCATTGI